MAVRAERRHRVEVDRGLELPVRVRCPRRETGRVIGPAILVVFVEAAAVRGARRQTELGPVCGEIRLRGRIVERIDDRDRRRRPRGLGQVGEVVGLLKVGRSSGLGLRGRGDRRCGGAATAGSGQAEPVRRCRPAEARVDERARPAHAEDLCGARRANRGGRGAGGDRDDRGGVRLSGGRVDDARGRVRVRGADRRRERAGDDQQGAAEQPGEVAGAGSGSRTRMGGGSEEA